MTPEGNACRVMIQTALDRYGLPVSESALRLLCMIAAHESGGFLYVKQVNGPALSFFQMEPVTYIDVCDYAVWRDYLPGELPSPPERLIFDAPFAAALGRLFFLRFSEPLPAEDDLTALAQYAKQYWNTALGKATVAQYESAYRKHFV